MSTTVETIAFFIAGSRCAKGGGECTISDRLAGEDQLVLTMATLFGVLDDAARDLCAIDEVANVFDDATLERRLAESPRRDSSWLARRRGD